MLYRTNRTYSANLNRLNLGTRSFALVAGELNGEATSRTRPALGVLAMRAAGMPWSPDPSIRPISGVGHPSIPGSSPVEPRPFPGFKARPLSWKSVAYPALSVTTANAVGRTVGGQVDPQARPESGRAERGRKPLQGKRSRQRVDSAGRPNKGRRRG